MALKDYEEIVENLTSPTLVLAGPGAGKTYLLSDRVNRLLRKDVDSSKITVVTFGKDASQNMRDELLNPSGHWKLSSNNLPKIVTLHSLGFEIVKTSPRTVGLRKKDLTVQPDEYIKTLLFRDASYILGYEKDDGDDARSCKTQGDCDPDEKYKKCAVCKKYWEIMAKCNLIDFDDQIIFACKILEAKPEILQEYQEKAEHLLVDEYQDINAAQHSLIELLSRKNRNGLFAVGDDAQSIYSFRGGTPNFILDFKRYYTEAETPPLLNSRRCHELIIENAEKVLIQYYDRWTGPFELKFHRDIDDQPYVYQMPSEITEAKKVAHLAKKYTGLGMSVLVLAPKKELFGEITKALSKNDIPHVCPTSLLPKHSEKRLRALLIITEWVQKPEDNFLTRQAIETTINGGVAKVPGAQGGKKTGPDTIKKRKDIEREVAALWEPVNQRRNLFKALKECGSISANLEKARNVLLGLLDEYEKYKRSTSAEFLKQVSLATGSWEKPKNFVDDVNIITRLLRESDTVADGSVRLMTMRKAKGLEADIVILVGLEEDIIPNPKSDLEEEARVFYVSMTRAKNKLYMLHSFRRPRNISYGPDITKKLRSRFLDAVGIDSEYIRMKA